MKKQFSITAFFFLTFNLFGQTSYIGFIDKYPIEFVADLDSNGVVNAIYAYSNFDTPIKINGSLKNDKLSLYEKDEEDKNKAVLIFENFDSKNNEIECYWKFKEKRLHKSKMRLRAVFQFLLTNPFRVQKK